MKYIPAVLMCASLAAEAVSPTPPPEPERPQQDLRQTLQQFSQEGALAPRRLTPVERAELRRQLSEYGQPQPVKRRVASP